MRRFELFSKRNKVIQHDILTYDFFSDKFRNQIFYIWKFALGFEYAELIQDDLPEQVFKDLRDTLCREHGLMKLVSNTRGNARECLAFLLTSRDTEMLLDLIELSINFTAYYDNCSVRDLKSYGVTSRSEDAVKELNDRFKENGLGYEFIDGILIRKDSEYIHQEVVKPALILLQEQGFDGALQEFLNAHDHFRKGNYKETIINASNAFESTMKTICAKKNWVVNGSGNASQLIKAIVDNELIPSYLQTHVNSLKTTLEGLSTVRNKNSGHGQGENAIEVPEHFVNYALHLCATNIVFLIQAYKVLPKR